MVSIACPNGTISSSIEIYSDAANTGDSMSESTVHGIDLHARLRGSTECDVSVVLGTRSRHFNRRLESLKRVVSRSSSPVTLLT